LNHKEENIVDDDDLIDPYDMSIMSLNSTQKGVYLFTDMIEWLKSDFEDDPIVDIKTKSTAATASAMIRKDKQMTTTTTTIQEEESIRMVSNNQRTTVNQTVTQEEMTTTTEVQCFNETQTENGSVLDALEHLAMIDDGTGSIDYALSQQIWDHIDDLIDAI
jgi:vacuolar-type H+-ATPase subunit I/STV1